MVTQTIPTMNRPQTAIRLVTSLCRLLVGHSDKLTASTRTLGGKTILMVTAAKCDIGRLYGPSGTLLNSLNRLGPELAAADFETVIEESTVQAQRVEHKRWDAAAVESAFREILKVIFNGDCTIEWTDSGTMALVGVTVGRGFDPDMLRMAESDLRIVFNAICRAHNHKIRISVTEQRKEVRA